MSVSLPPKLNPNCQCICHYQSGVMHVVACCHAPVADLAQANMLTSLADERAAAVARADQARDAALVEALSACKQVAETAREYSLPQMMMGANKCHDDISDLRIHAHAILALRDKPAPAVTVGIDALAYRFWSIHPKDIPDPVGMPEGYKGGARAWMYATEIRELISAIAGGGDE